MLAGALLVLAVLPSCTRLSVDRPYPAGWPERQALEGPQCLHVDGSYHNIAAATTNDGVVRESAKFPDRRLQALLLTGWPILRDTWSVASRAVVISRQGARLDDGSKLQSEAVAVRCETDGTLVYEFKKPFYGESFRGHETIRLVLSKLASGALAAHQLVERCGFEYLVIPHCYYFDDWYLFDPAD